MVREVHTPDWFTGLLLLLLLSAFGGSILPESDVLFLVGPTAGGKSTVAPTVAEELSAEIISMDSMAIYRGMDIATAKPSQADRRRVTHHLIDIVDPHEHFSAGQYVERATAAIGQIHGRRKAPLFVGGTPLYLKAMTEGLFDGPSADWPLRIKLEDIAQREGSVALHRRLSELDPKAAGRIHPNDVRRIVRALEVLGKKGEPISALQTQFGSPHGRFRSIMVALYRGREDLHRRIAQRVEEMFEAGLVEETRRLLSLARPMGRAARQAVGYGEVIAYLEGKLALDEAKTRIKARTRQLVRKQTTWLRKFEELTWINVAAEADVGEVVRRVVDTFRERMAATE